MPRVRFDLTVSIAHVVQVLLLLGALGGMWARLEHRLTAIEVKLDPMWQRYNDRVLPAQVRR